MSRSTEEIVKDHVRYMTSDVENWLGLLAEDVVFEFPFGQSVGAATVKGRQAAGDAVRGFLGLFEHLDLSLSTVYRLRDGSEAFAEFEGYIRVAPSEIHSPGQDCAARISVKQVVRGTDMVRGVVSIAVLKGAIQRRGSNNSNPKER